MNYQQTLDYLFMQLPMYQRVGKAAYKIDLSNTHKLCEILGNPERKFKSVHVAGTNGKGSTSHMLASVMQEAGYRVGLYTSPHLKDFRERIKINGEMISENEVISFVDRYQADFEKINLSFFEWTVGLAFTYFVNEAVDIVIVETGLGGRLDSTNVVTPEVSVITNIGLDHTQFLGDTLEKIAGEKAGIIKSGIPVIIGETQAETTSVFLNKAKSSDSDIQFADQIIEVALPTDLMGGYQQKNVKTCIATVNVLLEKGWQITQDNVNEGLLNVVRNVGLLGRWQVLKKSPLTICDTGHNEEGLTMLMEQIRNTPHNNLHVVFGVVNDKSVDKVLKLLPKEATYYFCAAKIPRALEANKLFATAKRNGLKGAVFMSVEDAVNKANDNASTEDLIFIGGSTFVVAEVV